MNPIDELINELNTISDLIGQIWIDKKCQMDLITTPKHYCDNTDTQNMTLEKPNPNDSITLNLCKSCFGLLMKAKADYDTWG